MVETLGKGAMLVEVRVPFGNARVAWIIIAAPSNGTGPDNWIKSGPVGGGCTNTIVILCALIAVGCPVRPDVTVPRRVGFACRDQAESEADSGCLVLAAFGEYASGQRARRLHIGRIVQQHQRLERRRRLGQIESDG